MTDEKYVRRLSTSSVTTMLVFWPGPAAMWLKVFLPSLRCSYIILAVAHHNFGRSRIWGASSKQQKPFS